MFCHPNWKAVESAFKKIFEQNQERAASICVYHRGIKVVDLWNGNADKSKPMESNTIVKKSLSYQKI